jgi:ferric-dicitrate binding protein FerR (iron transport regulator)
MKCEQIQKQISDAIIEKKPLDNVIAQHLSSCSDCRAFQRQEFAFAQRIIAEFKSGQIPVPDMAKITAKAAEQPARISLWPATLTSAAAVLLIVVLVYVIGNSQRPKLQNIGDQVMAKQVEPEMKRIDLPDGSYIVALPDANLIIKEMEREIVVKSDSKLYVNVSTNRFKPFQLITPAGTVMVYGTEFSVNVEKDNSAEPKNGGYSTTVYVLNGKVQLRTPKGNVTGTGGETLYVKEGSMPISYW